jgi:WD40 repeat protein
MTGGLVHSVAWSPDGKRLASANSYDKTVKVCDAESGRKLRTLKGHKGSVLSVAWSPDGKRLASAGDMVTVWEAESGRELLTVKGTRWGPGSKAWPGAQTASGWPRAVRTR